MWFAIWFCDWWFDIFGDDLDIWMIGFYDIGDLMITKMFLEIE